VCLRCATGEEYTAALKALIAAGHSVAGTSIIGGRAITTVELMTPIVWREWLVPAVEVPMPKAGRPKPRG